ncbi:diaminopimelate epimerase [Nocardia arthritidis]|uniref:Diaminopimelate epimerase n=1 Tax=Nocardia arthritidis TaxID=228602 RepID=A0A6G9YLR3_9NOCA|nr:diaminopimelate epimerase [Nocardia arthritidis]QIS13873.1 diaminopimelate epimerase [Nocardia arthritidis]
MNPGAARARIDWEDAGVLDIEFTKGHGTQNDFVVLPDEDLRLELTPERVAALCDRQRGLGADGVLRVARAGALLEAGVLDAIPAGIGADDWFMDYRNADGSIAEMCGNGVRVFAHYLAATGRESRDEYVVGSRGGARPVTVHASDAVNGEVTVGMGRVGELGKSTATIGGWGYPGIGIDVGNPHLACVDPGMSAEGLAKLDLTVAPGFDPDLFPNGVNVEILTALDADGGVDMRVYERGVGETRSCGTGTVAAAAAALAHEGFRIGEDTGEVTVRVPGGRLRVRLANGEAWMRGPSVLVASGRIASAWWSAQ